MLFIKNVAEMERAGAALAEACQNQACTISLIGDLGAGKTTFVRGFLRAFGYIGNVKSPTFTLVEPYQVCGYDIFHFDLYRLDTAEELENIGWRDYFNNTAICFIEWPDKAAHYLPAVDLVITIEIVERSRQLQIAAVSDVGKKIMIKYPDEL